MNRHSLLKKSAKGVLKTLRMITGIEMVTDLTLAVRKDH